MRLDCRGIVWLRTEGFAFGEERRGNGGLVFEKGGGEEVVKDDSFGGGVCGRSGGDFEGGVFVVVLRGGTASLDVYAGDDAAIQCEQRGDTRFETESVSDIDGSRHAVDDDGNR